MRIESVVTGLLSVRLTCIGLVDGASEASFVNDCHHETKIRNYVYMNKFRKVL